MQKLSNCFIMIAAIALLAPLCANASPITIFDAPISTGTYYGPSSNGGWTVTYAGGIEIGLRAKLRFPATPEIIDSLTNEYYVPVGIQDVGTPSAPKLRAMWNYDFSIFTYGSLLNLSDVSALLTITDMAVPSNTITFDPLGILDNAGLNIASGGGFGGVTTSVIKNLGAKSTWPNTVYGAQNSENPVFTSVMAPGFHPLTGGQQYRFDLAVTQTIGGNPLASESILVTTGTPEPASFLLFGGGLVLVGAYRRRKESKAS